MSSTRSRESAFKSSWNDASIVTCSGSQPKRSTMMFLKSSKLIFWLSKLTPPLRSEIAVKTSSRGAGGWFASGEVEFGRGLRCVHRRRESARDELPHHAAERPARPHLE